MQTNNYNNLTGESDKLKVVIPDTPFPNSPECLHTFDEYEIENILFSHPSRLIFVREKISGKRFVIKILIKERNPRCDLSTIVKRQLAQLYAVQWNKRITPDVYLGLAPVVGRVLDYSSKTIELGQIIENPEPADIDASSEYAVVMWRLPEELQLNTLLKYGAAHFLTDYVSRVTRHIADIHQALERLPISNDSGKDWGSCQQLQAKLQQNIRMADPLLATHPAYQAPFKLLSESLLEVFDHSIYQRYFEQRRLDRYIRCCHGDLKTQNIWIIPVGFSKEIRPGVKILDAIDFNLNFSNIDILSDFAMLVVDVHARTNSVSLVKTMIETYLNLTQQENEVARFVLDYYLLEKALVRASMRSASENLREPDQTFLEIANGYLGRLHSRIGSRQFIHI